MFDFDAVESVCSRERITLVIHPAIRRALRGYEESFYVGLRCFLVGEGDGLYFLPLPCGGHERLVFRGRVSPGGYTLIRIDPLRAEGLARIKACVSNGSPSP